MIRHDTLSDWQLRAVGFDYRHAEDFVIDRPRGSGDFLFLHFSTPIRICDRAGQRVQPAGTCILYRSHRTNGNALPAPVAGGTRS